MNLDQITTKCYILALFIRDDGERLLLGDGFYEFKQKLQHFQPNTYENDIVPLQGSDGQLLAGQVRRASTQSFDGYIGDATANRQIIEQKRTDFLTFFRKKHFYKVIYIFPDGTAIQRKRGYITDAPSVPELWQRFPEYHIALNFEDVNYYEYAEDEFGDEIYANIINIALSSALEGGLVWDAIGATTDGITWSNIQTAQGAYITVNNTLDRKAPLASFELLGNATQSGTPTPDAPIAVQTTTGENVVKVCGKNLFSGNFSQFDNTGGTGSTYSYFKLPTNGRYTLSLKAKNNVSAQSAQVFLGFSFKGGEAGGGLNWAWTNSSSASAGEIRSVPNDSNGVTLEYVSMYVNDAATLQWFTDNFYIQLESGSTATTYEPYQGQEFEVNLGKNLLPIASPTRTDTRFGITVTIADDGLITLDGTATGNLWPDLIYGIQNNTTTHASCYLYYAQSNVVFSTKVVGGTKTTTAGGITVAYNDTETQATIPFSDMTQQKTTSATNGINRAYIYIANGSVFNNYSFYLQVEKGSSASSFAPYFTPIELAKIGTYQDKIYKQGDDWFVHKEIGKVVLDSTKTWIALTPTASYYEYQGSMIFNPSAVSGYSFPLSDHFAGSTNNRVVANSSTAYVRVPTPSSLSTVDAFKSWLASNPTTVYYALATPTTTEITEQALIDQLEAILAQAELYTGTNNITTVIQAGNAQGEIEIGYYTEYDEDGSGYEWEEGGGGQNIVSVEGLDNAYPIWTITGQATNPTLTNITTGQTITWNGTVPAGQTLTIDMNEMTADLAGANVFEYITGEWLYLQPGNNRLTYTASGGATDDSILSWNGVAG